MATIATLRDLLEALIVSAKEENRLEEVTSNLETFYETVFLNEQLRNILSNTIFDIEERKEVVRDISTKASFSGITSGFLSLVVEMERFKSFINSKELVLSKLNQAAGRVTAELVSSEKLGENDIQRVKDALAKATGKKVDLLLIVDPSIIGGMIAKVEDRVYDSSLKTHLERMRGVLSPS